ncbi:MAG: UDP-glucose/GDP-mannose dehydrogenase family protein [Alphaproteobacteria bacterium]|nr:UDP-glucose/GDP-mannose dehydrogenase family protein [Alphaproteobacteria bacterium]
MRIAIIGTGYVGLVSGTCFSEFGHEVVCVDADISKIELLNQNIMPIYEPGLEDLVSKNKLAGRLSFTSDLKSALMGAEAVFIAVGTPSRHGESHADLSYVFQVAKDIAPLLQENAVIVTKSTVPVGTNRKIKQFIENDRPTLKFHIVSNPEFLREGAAIADFMRPDRIVIGHESEYAKDIMAKLYRPLYLIETPIIFTSLESSELAKYASNSFLATKITFMNEMSNLCEQVGADIHDVAKVMGLDGRIGKKFLHPSPGFGGSCFPKDLRALLAIGDDHNIDIQILKAVVKVNEERKIDMVTRIIKKMGDIKGKTIGILGLTFKPNTDDIRESSSLVIIPILLELGAYVKAYDPQGMPEAAQQLPDIMCVDNPYKLAENADALVVLTEWNEFRALDLKKIKKQMADLYLFDFRNIYNPKEACALGFDYVSLGRNSILHLKNVMGA